ncbi:hypothetical protein lerEdw1_018394 [Lerista edwardsae]|nr:hypothetical protein lerEdw1_018394 [Lerista edwardsae]
MAPMLSETCSEGSGCSEVLEAKSVNPASGTKESTLEERAITANLVVPIGPGKLPISKRENLDPADGFHHVLFWLCLGYKNGGGVFLIPYLLIC